MKVFRRTHPRCQHPCWILALALLGGACQEKPQTPPSAAAEQAAKTVVISYGIDMMGVNELISSATSAQTAVIYMGMFLTLLEEQADYETGPPTFLPRLAESYEFSPDRLHLTFHLRRNMVWSDGMPITARDVRWTWQAQVNPDVAWDYVIAKAQIRDVEVVDDYTVRFHFLRAYSSQLIDVNQGVILPQHAWGQLPFSEWRKQANWFREHLVVSGPYILESWVPNQRYILRRNPRYFEPGVPKMDRVVFQVTPDGSSQLALLRSRQVHLVDWIRPADAALVKADPGLDLYAYSGRQYVFVSWNLSHPLFKNREVRQALTMAVDRQAIIDAIYKGYAVISNSPFVSTSWAYNRNIKPWPYDPARAKQLLGEQGWRDTDGDGILDREGKPFRFEMLTNADNEIRRDILVLLQSQFQRVGIDMQPRTLEFNTLFAREQAHDYEASLASVGVDTSLNLYYFFHSKATSDGYNWGLYANPEVDRLIEEINQQTDFLSTKPLYDRVQMLIHEDQPVVFLYEPQRLIGSVKKLRNVAPNSISTFYYLRNWQLEP